MISDLSNPRTDAAPVASAVCARAGVLLATAPTATGEPAALQRWDGGTLLSRALDQLAGLGVADLHVITRPEWRSAVERAVEAPAAVQATGGPAEDLSAVAAIAGARGGDVVVALADVVVHPQALSDLLRLHRRSAVLVSAPPAAGRLAPLVRERRGRVVAAASPYHSADRPTGAFLGVAAIAAGDRPALAAVADRLAQLTADGVPAAWDAELRGKDPALREDIVSLLLTGIVRAGVAVESSRLNGLFWARPPSPEAAAAELERSRRFDADRALLDAAVKANDGFFTTFFVSPYSKFVARWAARRGVTPNQITTASFAVGLLAAGAFAAGDRWGLIAGAVLLQLAFTLDCVDGQLARYTRTFSTFGSWLDATFDRAKEYAVYAGLAIGAADGGVWLLAGSALALQTIRHTIYGAYRDVRDQGAEQDVQPPIEQPHDREAVGGAPSRWRRVARRPLVTWVRKMVAFPIGERFAVVSITAALFTPHVTFVVLLAWGGVAAAYTFTGRVLRSIR